MNRSALVVTASCLLLPLAALLAGYGAGRPEVVAALEALGRLTTDARRRPDPEEELHRVLSEQGSLGLATEDRTYLLFVKSVRNRRLVSPYLKERTPSGSVSQVVSSREGDLWVDPKTGVVHLELRSGEVISADGSRASFEEHALEFPLPRSLTPAPE